MLSFLSKIGHFDSQSDCEFCDSEYMVVARFRACVSN